MRVAMVHDWLVTYAGAERVLEQMLEVYPQADLYSLVDFLPPDQRGFIKHKEVRTSIIQHLPFARTRYRQYLPLMPLAIEQFDLSTYDLIISSSHAMAKGVITGPDQTHVCMCYSPVRYAWDLQHRYLEEANLQRGARSWMARWLLHRVRTWDYRTANGVDHFIAISDFIARRIWKVYRREATTIYPPVDVAGFALQRDKSDYYVTASRMVPYKRLDLIVEAFAAMPERRLVVVGDGPEYPKVAQQARSNVTLLGYQPFAKLRETLQGARAFVFAAEEDFGIAPLEAQACGTPVIAYGKGATLETIRAPGVASPTGVFFGEQSVASIVGAVETFEAQEASFTPDACRENAERFNPERFRREFRDFVETRMAAPQRSGAGTGGASRARPRWGASRIR